MELQLQNGKTDPAEAVPSVFKQDKVSLPKQPTYILPKTGLISHLPPTWVPYAQLMRLDKSGGFYAFYFPYLTGLSYAACISPHPLAPAFLFDRAALLFVGCVLLRGAACTFNDNIDQDYDRQIARCKLRPIARGAVSTTQAHIFTLVQMILGSLLFLVMPPVCALDAIPITLLFALYPFGKRFTNYPQFILGFPFAWAIIMASHAVGVDPLAKQNYISTLSLFFANVLWTMIYDTIYAHQDVEDDVKAGVNSMAVRFKDSTKLLTSLLAAGVLGLLIAAGVMMKASVVYFVMSCGGVAANLASMIVFVDLKISASCAWWFKWGFWLVGGSLIGGLIGEYSGRF